MTIEEIIELNKRNIRQALADYREHTSLTAVLDDVSEQFIEAVATDSAYSKQRLRELFRKSPVWDEQLQALIINGTRTHDPDYDFIYNVGNQILRPACESGILSWNDKDCIIAFFAKPNERQYYEEEWIAVINRVAPKAYAPTKKLSRAFKAICQAVGVADETAGSEFQRLYAQFADELSAKRISFKLFVSINPAHFITMSNPKEDRRGNTLTSCHSFNSTEYQYNNGCAGYACDDVSFIAFTVADPRDAETLNNRKTTRQVFAYDPGNGVLLQSRLYNTSGGTRGAQAESKVYRDLIQREIAALESTPNLWKTGSSFDKYGHLVKTGTGFGGYPDWIYSEFDGKISIRADHEDAPHPLVVGTYGRCICCAEKHSTGLYCGDCECYCDDCECCCDEDDLWTVYDRHGDDRRVCVSCRDNYYTYCDYCGEYHYNDNVTRIANGDYVCDDCLERHYIYCEECEEYHLSDDIHCATDSNGRTVNVCEDCLGQYYTRCAHCDEYFHDDYIEEATDPDTGEVVYVCPHCHEEYYPENEEENEEVSA